MKLFNRFKASMEAVETTDIDEGAILKQKRELYDREERVKINEDLLQARRDAIKVVAEIERDYQRQKEQAEVGLAKINEGILYKQLLYSELKDQKDMEIKLLVQSHAVTVDNYKEMVELLKTQVEVLTAKLTELKISDIHVHAEVKNDK